MPLARLGTWLALILVVVVLVLLVRGPRRALRSRSLTLLRCAFPAWRFFEEIADVPALSHRIIDASGVPGPWVPTLAAPRRHAGMWALNASGNLFLACQSLVEQCASDMSENAAAVEPTEHVSYRLVQALVEQQLRREHGARGSGSYQLRLSDGASPAAAWESPVHRL